MECSARNFYGSKNTQPLKSMRLCSSFARLGTGSRSFHFQKPSTNCRRRSSSHQSDTDHNSVENNPFLHEFNGGKNRQIERSNELIDTTFSINAPSPAIKNNSRVSIGAGEKKPPMQKFARGAIAIITHRCLSNRGPQCFVCP